MKDFPWDTLLQWYKKNGRVNLPWRDYSIPEKNLTYRVWISEIFLQQTQAERVQVYFTKVLEKYPDIARLSKTSYESFFPYYQGLGYYSRARNLLKTAAIVEGELGGVFPQDPKILQKLPGIGAYTSAAICAFGYGIPILAWDTNLEKVFARYYFGDRNIGLSGIQKEEVGKNLLTYIDTHSQGESESMKKLTRDINNALMDFARIVDKNEKQNIDWVTYPLMESDFYKNKGESEAVKEKKNTYFPVPDAHIFVVLHKDHREYYSESIDTYKPFSLPPGLSRDVRTYIQSYFRENYGLELSVRPVHKKWLSSTGEPQIMVNAQIQVGKHTFHTFGKSEASASIKMIVS